MWTVHMTVILVYDAHVYIALTWLSGVLKWCLGISKCFCHT